MIEKGERQFVEEKSNLLGKANMGQDLIMEEDVNFEDKNKRLAFMRKALEQAEISLSQDQEEKLHVYYERLIETNRVMNLTSITQFDQVVRKHFIDSLILMKYMNLANCTLLDVGTGAGFPGIPLKIACPDLKVVLLDSLNKRVQFLQKVIQELSLEHVQAIHGRAEDLGKRLEYREQFDICVSRAVANLASLAEYCLPFVKKNGFFISYKSGEVQEELDDAKYAIEVLGGKKERTETFFLPGSDIGRSLIFIHKENLTPKKYPRKAGTPAKEPLVK